MIWRLRNTLLLLAIGICVGSIGLIVITWGLLDAHEYASSSGCSEIYYNINNELTYDLNKDHEALKQCRALPVTKRYTDNRSSSSRHDVSNGSTNSRRHSHLIKTKCAQTKPVLLSRKTEIRQQNKGDDQEHMVPNIVHFISFGRVTFSFLNYLSVLSVHRFIIPEYIYLHGDQLPHGYWWNRTVVDVSNLYHVFREQPMRVQGIKIPWVEHRTDIVRLQTLLGEY